MRQFRLFWFLLWMAATSLQAEIEQLAVRVISVLPHDPEAFTQGLAIYQNRLYESTGLYGQSSLREIDLENGSILRQVRLPVQYFGEGIAVVQDKIVQLTWQEQLAFVYDVKSLTLLSTIPYEGEGWGLCSNGSQLLMSNGSSIITKRDATALRILKSLQVTNHNKAIKRINDLECVDNTIYANVWGKEIILNLDKETGRLMGVVNASALLTPAEKKQLGFDDVLNGICYHPERHTFFITGKRWPKIFEVQFVKKP